MYGRVTWKHTLPYVSQQEFAVWLRKHKQGLYINLEGWDWEGSSKERGYTYTYG